MYRIILFQIQLKILAKYRKKHQNQFLGGNVIYLMVSLAYTVAYTVQTHFHVLKCAPHKHLCTRREYNWLVFRLLASYSRKRGRFQCSEREKACI